MVTTTTGLATSFIQFSRTSNATVTGADGRIRWAGHNLLTNSESFDASAWRKESVTVTANFAAAPNGTTTADRAVYAGGLGTPNLRLIDQQVTMNTSSVAFTLAIWVSGTGKFRLKNTHVGVVDNFSSDITATATPTLYTLAVTNGSTNGGSQQVGIVAATTDDAFDLRIWGAHLYRSDLGGMVLNPARGDAYYPTTPRNLLGFTEDFFTIWGRSGISALGSGSIANAIIAPNGLQTADKLAASAVSGVHIAQQPFSTMVSGTTYIASVYVKAAEYSKVGIRENATTGAFATFNLVGSGSVISSGAGGTGTIAALSDGWYRISMSSAAGSANYNLTISLLDNGYTSGSPASYTFTGDGVSGLYLWGAQLSDSASLDAYSPVYGAAVTSAAYYAPRLDFDPVTLAARGLLVEEQRTNFLLHTADFTNASGWFASGATPTSNDVIAPDGTQSADKIVFTSTSGLILQDYTTTTSATYCGSVWLRADSNTTLILRVQQSGGGSASITCNITTSWQRFDVAYVATSPTFIRFSILANSNTPTVYAWGAQLEAGSFATSYIPNGSAVAGATRTADVASVSTQAFPYSASEGSVVVSADVLSTANTNSANLWSFYIDSNNIMRSWIWDGAKTTPRGTVIVAGSTSAEMTNGTVSANTPFKTGTALKQNDFAFSLNGASPATDPSGPVIAATNALWLGSLGGTAASSLNGHIRQITYLPRRISNAELQARTV